MKFRGILLILLLILFVPMGYLLNHSLNADNTPQTSSTPTPIPATPTPTPIVLKEALPSDAYTIFMVGDSMTEALGPNSDKLRQYLKVHYPNKVFGIFNLAKGSTSILTVQEIIEKELLSRQFEVILIESFGNNPLSNFPLEEGLKKQTEALDKIVETIRTNKTNAEVNSIIVFVATIAPNRDKYGEGEVDLTLEKRHEWADERTAYIKNHIEYAKQHNIPLINIYEKSLNKEGTGDLQYLETQAHIHPSGKGIELISKEIADFLYTSKILPP